MKRILLVFLGLLTTGTPTMGQGTLNITPVFVGAYAREFLLTVDNGIYGGALYGAVSNSPAPTLVPLFPLNAPNNYLPVVGSHLTFANPITLGFPEGTPMLLQVQCWITPPYGLGPFGTHYNSSILSVTLAGSSPPVLDFGTVVVPLVPEPGGTLLATLGGGILLVARWRRRV